MLLLLNFSSASLFVVSSVLNFGWELVENGK